MTRRRQAADPDAQLVRRTALRVGLFITVAATILVTVVLVAAFSFVLARVPFADLFDRNHHEETVDVGGLDALVGVVVLGLLAIALAGSLSLVATRRAVAPLVDALARQRRFVADASHELRTPLTILDARLQVLERSLSDHDRNRQLVAELRGDSDALVAVVTDLLDSLDVAIQGSAVPVPVAAAVETAVSAMGMAARAREVRVTAAATPHDADVLMPEASLHRALVALIDNAVKHSPRDSEVSVVTMADRKTVVIDVVDHGGGIRGISPDRVFDRFARSSEAVGGGGDARSGFGIGLFLVQEAVGRFGGSVEVVDTSSAGTTMRIRLPRAAAHRS